MYRIDPYNKDGDSYYKYRGRLTEIIKKKNNPVRSFGDFNSDGKIDDMDQVKSVSLIKVSHSVKSSKVNTTDITRWAQERKTKLNRKKNNLRNQKNKRPVPRKRFK